MSALNLRWNVSAGYVSQLYSALIGIVMVPMYLRYMGTEAYGLIGMYAVFQLCIQSLDLGVTPTLTRESARTHSGAGSALQLRRLLRLFEIMFVIVGAIVILTVWGAADYIATGWINGVHLGVSQIRWSLILMGVLGWLRWYAGLYRGIINGFERQVWQSGMSMVIATAHSIVVLPYLAYVGATPICFFAYQAVIGVIELIVMMRKSYRTMPAVASGESIGFRFEAVRNVFHFSAFLAVTTTLWVAVTQVDRVVLSRMLTLPDFGLYALATVVAGGVTTLAVPLGSALIPRLTSLESAGRNGDFLAVYENATQFTAVLALSAAIFLAVFSGKILWVWTGDAAIASNAADVLRLYALGNGVLAFISLPYYLQFAKGKLRLHLIGTLVFLAILVPAVVLLSRRFGAVGAGMAWFATNLAYFMLWIPLVHRSFLGGIQLRWLTRDILPIGLSAGAVALFANVLVVWPGGRVSDGVILAFLSVTTAGAGAMASGFVRRLVVEFVTGVKGTRHRSGRLS